jgi:hypothetical protein
MRKATITATVLVLAFASCSGDSRPTASSASGVTVSLHIAIGKLAAFAVRSTVVVTGPDFEYIKQELVVNGGSVSGAVPGIPVGAAREFTVRLYDDTNIPIYAGSTVTDLPLSDGQSIEIILTPVSSMYRRQMTLPATPSFGIAQYHGGFSAGDELVVIGDTQNDAHARDAGEAYLWSISGEHMHTLRAPLPREGDGFGNASLINEGTVFVGSDADDVLGEVDAGAVYVFDAQSGALIDELRGDIEPSAQFGSALAYVDGLLLVGAPGAVPNGAVYVFDGDRNSSGYLDRMAKLDGFAFSEGDGSRFGGALAAGDKILIGDAFYDAGGINVGAVHVYDRVTLSLLRTIEHPEPSGADQFGHTIAVSGGIVAIGAVGVDGVSLDEGAVYVYDTDGNLNSTIGHPEPGHGGLFGWSLSLSGEQLLTGGSETEAAYLYDLETTDLVARFESPFPQEDSRFGVSVGFLERFPVIASRKNVYILEKTTSSADAVVQVIGTISQSADVTVTGIVSPDTTSVRIIGST